MEIVLKGIINIFTVIDGNIYILVKKNKLIEFTCDDEIDTFSNKYISNIIKSDKLDLKQCYTFSKKENNKLTITVLYIDIVNYNTVKILGDYSFIELNKLDNNIYISKSIEYLKNNLVLSSNIKKLYPNEFVLPEIQKLYEELLGKKYDRRNFRKRLIKLNIIENINKMSSNRTGRPAKLYKFNELTEEKSIF